MPATLTGCAVQVYAAVVLYERHDGWALSAVHMRTRHAASATCVQDYSACKWPPGFPGGDQPGSEATAQWFDAANEGSLQQPGWAMLQQVLGSSSDGSSRSGNKHSSSSSNDSRPSPDVISFSHFLPHQHLLPEKRMLTFPNLVSCCAATLTHSSSATTVCCSVWCAASCHRPAVPGLGQM